MKITVDQNKCSGHARCNATAPELFDIDDSGYVAFASREVPAGAERQARAAAQDCPERAITLED
ncbi:ferredoxin [Streptomyces phaeochromogenes]|uniref:ferredoxin n=1 Tax=Streptomyces phaeochromogenes TaxID=1923 RepID=UPI00367C0007